MTEIKAVKTLIRHGLEVRDTRYIPITSHSVDRLETIGESIPDETDRIDASVLVMGAYTHSRIQQFLLGGVTRDIVAKTRIPVVMTHKTSEMGHISFCNNRKISALGRAMASARKIFDEFALKAAADVRFTDEGRDDAKRRYLDCRIR